MGEQCNEIFEVVDEAGKVIGTEKRAVVHARGLRHRGIYLLVFDEQGRVFLQQRAKDKDLMPLKWDLSVAEHLLPGESYRNACLRGAKEELSIKVRNLKFLAKKPFHFKYPGGEIDNELNQLFVAEKEGGIKFQDGEVQQGKFVSLLELLQEMKEKPGRFTPWFLNCRKEIEELARGESALH